MNHTEEIGGGERSLLMLLKDVDRKKYELFINSNSRGRFSREVEKLDKITSFRTYMKIPLRRLLLPWFLLPNLLSAALILYFIKSKKINIVHISHLLPLLMVVPAKLLDKRLAIIFHCRSLEARKEMLLRKICKSYVDRVIANSKYTLERFCGNRNYLRQKTDVVYNGVDLDNFAPSDDVASEREELGLPVEKKLVGIIGRIVKYKGHEEFFKAGKLLLESIDDINLVIIGEEWDAHSDSTSKDHKLMLTHFVREAGIKPFVIWTGFQERVDRYLCSLDVLVVPSHYEWFGRSALEGIACGLPVVIFKGSGGLEEIITGNGDGVIVEKQEPIALANAISRILKDHEYKLKVSEFARERALKFSSTKYVNEIEEVYESVV